MRLLLIVAAGVLLIGGWFFLPSLSARFGSGGGPAAAGDAEDHAGAFAINPSPSPMRGQSPNPAANRPNEDAARSAPARQNTAEPTNAGRPVLGRDEPRVGGGDSDRTIQGAPGGATDRAPTGAPRSADPAPKPPGPDRPVAEMPREVPLADPGRGPGASREIDREMQRVTRGREEIAMNRPVDGRRTLSLALRSGVLPPRLADEVRSDLARINERLVFSPEVLPDDPYVMAYTIEDRDALSRLPRKLGVQTDWRFMQRINNIRSPSSIQVGRRLKVVTGPFHAVVHKNDFRLDLWLGDEADPVFVRSFRVGLGADDGTPEGRFRVRPGSKLINPEWINPRTRERFLPDDPMNPIGEHWIGLTGDEPHLVTVEGYGLHGTIEPQSIGTQSSMGCVRMLADDIALLYEVLTEPASVITIRR